MVIEMVYVFADSLLDAVHCYLKLLGKERIHIQALILKEYMVNG